MGTLPLVQIRTIMHEDDRAREIISPENGGTVFVRDVRDWVSASNWQNRPTTFNSIYNDDGPTRTYAITSRNIHRITHRRGAIITIVASLIGTGYGVASIINYVTNHGWH